MLPRVPFYPYMDKPIPQARLKKTKKSVKFNTDNPSGPQLIYGAEAIASLTARSFSPGPSLIDDRNVWSRQASARASAFHGPSKRMLSAVPTPRATKIIQRSQHAQGHPAYPQRLDRSINSHSGSGREVTTFTKTRTFPSSKQRELSVLTTKTLTFPSNKQRELSISNTKAVTFPSSNRHLPRPKSNDALEDDTMPKPKRYMPYEFVKNSRTQLQLPNAPKETNQYPKANATTGHTSAIIGGRSRLSQKPVDSSQNKNKPSEYMKGYPFGGKRESVFLSNDFKTDAEADDAISAGRKLLMDSSKYCEENSKALNYLKERDAKATQHPVMNSETYRYKERKLQLLRRGYDEMLVDEFLLGPDWKNSPEQFSMSPRSKPEPDLSAKERSDLKVEPFFKHTNTNTIKISPATLKSSRRRVLNRPKFPVVPEIEPKQIKGPVVMKSKGVEPFVGKYPSTFQLDSSIDLSALKKDTKKLRSAKILIASNFKQVLTKEVQEAANTKHKKSKPQKSNFVQRLIERETKAKKKKKEDAEKAERQTEQDETAKRNATVSVESKVNMYLKSLEEYAAANSVSNAGLETPTRVFPSHRPLKLNSGQGKKKNKEEFAKKKDIVELEDTKFTRMVPVKETAKMNDLSREMVEYAPGHQSEQIDSIQNLKNRLGTRQFPRKMISMRDFGKIVVDSPKEKLHKQHSGNEPAVLPFSNNATVPPNPTESEPFDVSEIQDERLEEDI